MNRGNLAEDPRSGLPSSSRYSRNGGEANSLLYVDSSSVRKERKAAERRAARQGNTVKGYQNSKKRTNVGRGLADSHMDRLEVGSDGRLFKIKESPSRSTSEIASSKKKTPAEKGYKNTADDIRPAIAAGAFSDAKKTAESRNGDNSDRTPAKSAKPEREYLSQPNPLLAQKGGKRHAFAAFSAQKNGKKQANAVLSADKSGETRRKKAAPGAAALPAVPSAGTEALPAASAVSTKAPSSAADPIRSIIRRFRVPIISAVVAAASVGYVCVAYHYRNRFYPGTEFFGIQAAGQSVYDVKAAVKAKVDSYSLELVTREPLTDGSENGNSAAAAASAGSKSSIAPEKNDNANIITAEDVAMVYRDSGEIDRAMKNQKVWAWPVMMIARLADKSGLALETSYDESLVTDALGSLACMQKENMISPQDAKVVLTDDGARVQTEIYGTTLNFEKTEEAVRKALNDGSTSIDLDALGLYENPGVNSSDLSLTQKAMAMNKVLGAKILMRFGSDTEVINSEVISRFLDEKNGTYSLNEEKVERYVARLSKKYDTYQCSREFFTSIGTKVQLEEGVGDYGWQLDQEATYEKLLESIRGQKKTTIDPIFSREAYCRGTNDIGDSYVEISLTNQKMWFYKDGNLVVETPVVTGNPYAGHETPSGGVWSIKGRMRNQTLSGQGYTSPVDYWMPFNGGVGIHDMQSRAWFGGSIYLGGGSHGCINTPLAAVKLVYDQIVEGMPVIVYKDESEEALAQVTGPYDAQSLNAQIEETFGTVEDDGIGSIVKWSRSQAAQAAQAAAASAAQQTSAAGTSVS